VSGFGWNSVLFMVKIEKKGVKVSPFVLRQAIVDVTRKCKRVHTFHHASMRQPQSRRCGQNLATSSVRLRRCPTLTRTSMGHRCWLAEIQARVIGVARTMLSAGGLTVA
jgi:hypothetical protein